MTIVAKFGGSSLATAEKLRQVRAFVEQNRNRKYIVVSAAGKRNADDPKVTDLLRECTRLRALKTRCYHKALQGVFDRHFLLVQELGIELDLGPEFQTIAENVQNGRSDDYIESRGEYLMGKIVACLLGRSFVDPARFVRFDKRGLNEYMTYSLATTVLKRYPTAVIPGYYGGMLHEPSQIKVFPRGGSDISGAIVARAISAKVYENCTDVYGVLAADPRIVENPVTISVMTHRETRELAYMGASVLHPDALYPVHETQILTRVLNTSDPSGADTRIVSKVDHRRGKAIGVAGRKGFTAISIARSSIHTEIGFSHNVLGILKEWQVSYEHMPGGLDSISLIIDDRQLVDDKLKKIVSGIERIYPDAEIIVRKDLAMIAVVGEGMVHVPGTAARLFGSLAKSNVNVSMINQGASEMVVGIGVDSGDYEKAIRAIYRDCVEK